MVIKTFESSEFGGIRCFEDNEQIWMVLNDICDVLEVTRRSRVVDRLDEDEVRKAYIEDEVGRQQETYIVNESGFYHIVLRSNKERAKPFRRWVTDEVLPTIRKTGKYEDLQNCYGKYIPVSPLRRRVTNKIKDFCKEVEASEQSVWTKLYIGFSEERRSDIRKMAKKYGCTKIQAIENEGLLEKFDEYITEKLKF